jgi:hypothetical protein
MAVPRRLETRSFVELFESDHLSSGREALPTRFADSGFLPHL